MRACRLVLASLLLLGCGDDDDTAPGPDSPTNDAPAGADGAADGPAADAMPQTPPSGFDFEGPELTICDGAFHAPTLALGEGRIAVGCLPDGSQNTTPVVKFLDAAGSQLGEADLLTSDGYYYKDTRLSYHDGRFQTIYEYNCDDNGSWLVGWGWGCIDFREYDDTGDVITQSVVFGETGHNGHPVLDWSGSDFGVGWVSYDDVYFRRIGADRTLAGGGPEANLFVGHDPASSDDRSGARTRIVWDGLGYGIFSIIGYRLYVSRVEAGDFLPVTMHDLGPAYSQTFGGQLDAVATPDGDYAVVYYDTTNVVLIHVDRNGELLGSTLVQAGEYRQPQMLAYGGRYYVMTQDAGGRGFVTVFGEDFAEIEGAGGFLGGGLGRIMTYPVVARDEATGAWVSVYQDMHGGVVRLQRLVPVP